MVGGASEQTAALSAAKGAWNLAVQSSGLSLAANGSGDSSKFVRETLTENPYLSSADPQNRIAVNLTDVRSGDYSNIRLSEAKFGCNSGFLEVTIAHAVTRTSCMELYVCQPDDQLSILAYVHNVEARWVRCKPISL